YHLSVVLWDDGSVRLGMVGKRREVVQVPTKQGNQISLRFLLKPLLKSQTQRCHVDGYQEAHLVAVRDSSQPGAQRITEGWLFFHQCIEIDGSDRGDLHDHVIAGQKTGPLLLIPAGQVLKGRAQGWVR